MVADRLENAGLYGALGAGISKALKYLQTTDFETKEPGRYDIEGDELYALVQEYDTRPAEKGMWESHRSYADVQFVYSGAERMGYARADSLEILQPYDGDGDCVLYRGEGGFIRCPAGTFAIFLADDAHMPCVADGQPAQVKKVVVKVLIVE